jgi:hypothetical protein
MLAMTMISDGNVVKIIQPEQGGQTKLREPKE